MFGAKHNQVGPIGLDIGYDAVRMIQLGHSEEGLCVVAADSVRIDTPEDSDELQDRAMIVDAIKEMRSGGEFVGRDVVVRLPNDTVKIKSMRLDIVDPGKIDQYMNEQVAVHFDLNAGVDEIRNIVAGNVHQGDDIKSEVIFFGVDRATIASQISIAEDAGLVPISIDVVPCSLFRSFQASHRREEDQDLVSVFVEVGTKFTTVVIGRGREISFIKQIPIAGEQFNLEVAEKLNITCEEAGVLRGRLHSQDDEGIDSATRQMVIDAMNNTIEQLAREVSLCFRYYAVTFRGERPEEAVFTGGEAYESTLLNALKRHLGIEIKIAQPLRGFDLSRTDLKDGDHSELCEWAVAVGLSMKGWDMSVSRV